MEKTLYEGNASANIDEKYLNWQHHSSVTLMRFSLPCFVNGVELQKDWPFLKAQ